MIHRFGGLAIAHFGLHKSFKTIPQQFRLKCSHCSAHQPTLSADPDAATDTIIEQGREVGLLARKMFPGGVEVRNEGLDEAIVSTRDLRVILEVAAIYQGGAIDVHRFFRVRNITSRWSIDKIRPPAAF